MFQSRVVHVHNYAPCACGSNGHCRLERTQLGPRFCRSSGAALALCSGPRAREHQNDGDHKAANAVADVSLEASAAANKHKPSGKQPSEMHASQQTQQSGAATDKASFTFSKASRAEATQALASVGLTSDLIEALVENFTTDQLQACLENAQQMDSSTGAATPTSETQPGAMQADPTPPAPAAELSTRRHHAGALPGAASQMSAEAAAQAADDRTGRRLLLDDVRAADASEASDAAAHVGVLLVSGSHVRHWLAATNMVGYLQPTPLQPSPSPPPPLPQVFSHQGCASYKYKAILHAKHDHIIWIVPADVATDSAGRCNLQAANFGQSCLEFCDVALYTLCIVEW